MKFKSDASGQKLRGGYYTPELIVSFLTRWALSPGVERVLEPSCGDGRFLTTIAQEINDGRVHCKIVDGVEIVKEESEKTLFEAARLTDLGVEVNIINDDFMHWINIEKVDVQWDAVLGNPPYIRYQYCEKEQQEQAQIIFERSGVSFTKRTNAWVPFVVASVSHLKPCGRLAMVVPSEIMHAQHAQGLRLFLEDEMERVVLIHIRDLVFADAEQGILLLLAEKKQLRKEAEVKAVYKEVGRMKVPVASGSSLQIEDIHGLDDLKTFHVPAPPTTHRVSYHGDWMRALLTAKELSLLDKIVSHTLLQPLGNFAEVGIGIVTGANNFFVVDEETLERYDFRDIASPMLARSEFIKGITFTDADHIANIARGLPVHLLRFPNKPTSELPANMVAYLKRGVADKLPERYKCKIREPWYVVPYIWSSELALLKRCHLYPRVILNEAKALSTDTAYRLKMKQPFTDRVKDFTFSFLNSLSFLHAELFGRHYAGGMLELIPSEIERIPLPLVGVSDKVFAQVDNLIRSGCSLDALLTVTDVAILQEGIGLTSEEVLIIRRARERMTHRRLRSKSGLEA